ncbi:MAG: hypothetical protein IH628_17250, partial [Proteobacteria bacterium]|nr:hypothetical protein [Pseudomonadota bacterium]
PKETPIQIRQTREFLLVSCWNYRGESMNCSRDELTAWHTGFYLELHPQTAFPRLNDFVSYVAGISVDEQIEHACRRRVTVRSGEDAMEMIYDPFRELILSRSWNGTEEGVVHFEVEAGGPSPAEFSVPNLYGSELLP